MIEIPSSRREKIAWSMYDFANSGYTTVVLTTIYNAWFVSVIAMNGGFTGGEATLLWTLTFAIGNAIILLTAPLVGAIADIYRLRKTLLAASTLGCVIFTALLSVPQAGDVNLAMLLLVVSYVMFATGENLIAAFLPELASRGDIGRLSGYGWALGFVGGLFSLGLCLLYINYAQSIGQPDEKTIPLTMLIVAAVFALAAIPTFYYLQERSHRAGVRGPVIKTAVNRLRNTLTHLHLYPDLRRFMVALTLFHAGIYIVVILAAIYADQVMGFTTQQNIVLISIVNITATLGAFIFGHLQDRLGSVRTLMLTLGLWCAAIIIIWWHKEAGWFWLAANLIGLAMGASQSASRALIGLFSPVERYGEFFGFWGLCVKLAAIIGPVTYGLFNWLNRGDHQQSLLITLVFFIAGMLVMLRIDEQRGIRAARQQ
ncbi:MFS transporter [Sulfuriflexus sp.]|uniref:MFS transporter n=1 Tax=Sulfuriflexus sp. TaxID=2015443 RepID=UPI0028CF0F59|nr:MFS transporter [Sulfuriflexus sp.]MDT8405122.1 MFS transporter [Sulfuriflexus sp.]